MVAMQSVNVVEFHRMTDHPAGSPARQPMVIVNPGDDREFVARVDAAVEAGAARPVDLQATLRERYPAAVVRRRDLSDEVVEVWYVYRDGRWIARQDA